MKTVLSIALSALTLWACSKSDNSLVNSSIASQKNELPTSKATTTGLIYQWDFDEQNPLHDLIELTEDAELAVDPLNAANKTLKFTLRPGSYRSEASMGNATYGVPHFFDADSQNPDKGEEIWVGFRVLVHTKDFVATNSTPSIAQIGPLYNPTVYPGVRSAGHMQLLYEAAKTRWRWREFKSVFNPNEYSGVISPSEYGKWETFVMHARIRSDDQGLIEVWRNGTLIYRSLRQNAIAGDRTRVKWGMYIGAGNEVTQSGECYFDDIKIGGSNSSYDEVLPK